MKKRKEKNHQDEDRIVFSSKPSIEEENPFAVLKSFFPEQPLGSNLDEPEKPQQDKSLHPNDVLNVLLEKTIVISKSKSNRAGKTVTILNWRETNEEALMAVLHYLKKVLGCGGGLEKNEQNHWVIILQGDLRERVKKVLEARRIKVKMIGN